MKVCIGSDLVCLLFRVRDVGEKKCQDVLQRYEDERKLVKKQYNCNMDVSLIIMCSDGIFNRYFYFMINGIIEIFGIFYMYMQIIRLLKD